jgi:hypothetical protein
MLGANSSFTYAFFFLNHFFPFDDASACFQPLFRPLSVYDTHNALRNFPPSLLSHTLSDRCGERLSPQEWHAALDTLKATDSGEEAVKPLVLDCRNHYESEV